MSKELPSLVDPRWESVVRPNLLRLKEALRFDLLRDGLYSAGLITSDDRQRLYPLHTNHTITGDQVAHVLIEILPKAGPNSYDTFVKILEETKGQGHVAKILSPDSPISSLAVGSPSKKPLGDCSNNQCFEKRRFKETEGQENVGKILSGDSRTLVHARSTAAGKRVLSPAVGSPSKKPLRDRSNDQCSNDQCSFENQALREASGRQCQKKDYQWKMTIPPVPEACKPHGRVAMVNENLFVGSGNTMYTYDLSEKEWQELELTEVDIFGVFECGNRCYVMGRGQPYKNLNIYEWELRSKSKTLTQVTQLPKNRSQLSGVSGIGYEGKLYFAGGPKRVWPKPGCEKRIDCYDIEADEWTEFKDEMKIGRQNCSLAVIDDILYVGGGTIPGTVEGFPTEEIEGFPTEEIEGFSLKTKSRSQDHCLQLEDEMRFCELVAFNGSLVATGGKSTVESKPKNAVKIYDQKSKSWLQFDSMKRERLSHGVCATAQGLFVVGGDRGEDNVSVECLSKV